MWGFLKTRDAWLYCREKSSAPRAAATQGFASLSPPLSLSHGCNNIISHVLILLATL